MSLLTPHATVRTSRTINTRLAQGRLLDRHAPFFVEPRNSYSGTASAPRGFLNCRNRRCPASWRTSPSSIVLGRSGCFAASGLSRFDAPQRTATTASDPSELYEAIVVGAGPSGITAVGNLLESHIEPVLWVDHDFKGGRVNKYYREVPSNTKVKLFIDYATSTRTFREAVNDTSSTSESPKQEERRDSMQDDTRDALEAMRNLDQEKGCSLSYAADMCLRLTDGLRQSPGVIPFQGNVLEALLDNDTSQWLVRMQSSEDGSDSARAATKRLILCTGSAPLDPPLPVDLPIHHLDLDDALSPTRLSKTLSPEGKTTVAVVGASHSAILVLMNLSSLALNSIPSLRIKWFTRHPLRYAEYEDGFIARDNTGLKGEAAVWARENLEPETMPHSPVNQCISKIAYQRGDEKKVYAEHLPNCDFIIQAIGYERNTLPRLRSSATGQEIVPLFDHDKGYFRYIKEPDRGSVSSMVRLPGLFGAGIAFPERVVDKKYGHEEMNVGFFKFMNAVKKWMPEWRAALPQ